MADRIVAVLSGDAVDPEARHIQAQLRLKRILESMGSGHPKLAGGVAYGEAIGKSKQLLEAAPEQPMLTEGELELLFGNPSKQFKIVPQRIVQFWPLPYLLQ